MIAHAQGGGGDAPTAQLPSVRGQFAGIGNALVGQSVGQEEGALQTGTIAFARWRAIRQLQRGAHPSPAEIGGSARIHLGERGPQQSPARRRNRLQGMNNVNLIVVDD